MAFVTHVAEIRRILSGIGWPIIAPEFDSPHDLVAYDICQLVSRTKDGFHEAEEPYYSTAGPDPPTYDESCVPPLWQDTIDPPHWES